MSTALENVLLETFPAFTPNELQRGVKLFEVEEVPARHFLLEAGNVCDHLFFAESSIVRCFSEHEGEEHILWMKPEAAFLTEYKSFVQREPSMFSLQCYEPTTVYKIHHNVLRELCASSQEWAQFGIALTENLHVRLIEVFVSLLQNDATRNYEYIAYAFPRFLQVAPLKDIASMLNISPVSLSRIRAGTQTKDRY